MPWPARRDRRAAPRRPRGLLPRRPWPVPSGRAAPLLGWAALLWRWFARRRLSSRLIADLVLLLTAACAAVGATSYVVLKNSLMASLDSQLQAASGRYAACVHQGNPPHPDPDDTPHCMMVMGQAEGTFNAQMVNGVFMHKEIVGGTCPLSAADEATLRALPPYSLPQDGGGHGDAARPDGLAPLPDLPAYTRDLPSIGGNFRLTALRDPGGDVLFTGIPLAGMESTLGRVELGELTVFGAVVLLAGAGGIGMVRFSLRPLRRVAATATLVSEMPLEAGDVAMPKGVPGADPRTEVGQVGAAFNRMLGHVESALARRAASEARLRRFAADASHELRTPLSAIRGYAELALRHRGPLPGDVTHALQRVESESARMSVLVDELLLLARLDAGRPLAREPVDLSRLAIDAASDARAARPGHRWLLDLPGEPVMVRGDGHRLHQVLVNLLGNAGRHTPPGTTVTVALAATHWRDAAAARGGAGPRHLGRAAAGAAPGGGDARAGSVELSVTDDGPGIPADLLPDLFERFVRAGTSRSHAAGGSGLGLAIVDAVVAAHQGSVSVTSRPGRTCFTITLPCLAEDADPALPPAP
ncbi:MAG TPA: HAMP domain-containing sensor histidine kinase [Streptosporangiaceae bacterium]|nr:HAMP domain-containing sensor histidine kinase [Streptosporangiaceae bacterium]